MRGAYSPYALVVWPMRNGRATLAGDSMSEPCDEGALVAMANTTSSNELCRASAGMTADMACTDAHASAQADSGERTIMPGKVTAGRRFAAVAPAVAAARDFTNDIMRIWQVPHDVSDDAALVVSELVTNAVRASGLLVLEPNNDMLAKAPLLGLQLTMAQGVLLIEVWDGMEGVPELRQQYEAAEGGRGLFLVSTLADRWSYYLPDSGGKVVWAELTVQKEIEQVSGYMEFGDGPQGEAHPAAIVFIHADMAADVTMLERILWGMMDR